MSKVSRRDRIETEHQEPTLGGDYVTVPHVQNAWRCDGCGRVWERRHRAEACESLGHPNVQVDRYGGWVENGAWRGGRAYEHFAIRRESLDTPAVKPLRKMRQIEAMPKLEEVQAMRASLEAAPPAPVRAGSVLARMSPGAARLLARRPAALERHWTGGRA